MAQQSEAPEKTAVPAEQKRMLQKVSQLLPDAKVFQPKPDGKYYGPVLHLDKHFVVQEVGYGNAVAHRRDALGELPFEPTNMAKKAQGVVIDVNYQGERGDVAPADPERWNERSARTPASELNTAVARSHLGQNVLVHNPPSETLGLSPRYEGVAVAVNETTLIQRLNNRSAIVHEISADQSKAIGAGQPVAVQYRDGKLASIEAMEVKRTRTRTGRSNETEQSDPERARKNSYGFALGHIRRTYGQDVKLYDASKVGKDPVFRGSVVAVTDHHLVQRVASNSFIAHDKKTLEGEMGLKKLVAIAYQNGQAKSQQIQRSRPKEQSNDRGMTR